jgi:hypothetical protein
MFARSRWIGFAFIALAGAAVSAQAQPAACRSVPATDGPPRTIISCRGVTIEVERDARYGLGDPGRDGTPRTMQLEGGAALIEVERGARRQFQIQTPHAIASVRGTQWFVEAGTGTSAVLVLAGEVGVTARPTGAAAILGPTQGIDVTPGTDLQPVRVWGEPRVRAALARFGR